MSRSVTEERDSGCEKKKKKREGRPFATLTPGAPDDSSVARWTSLYAHSYTNIPTHVHQHTVHRLAIMATYAVLFTKASKVRSWD